MDASPAPFRLTDRAATRIAEIVTAEAGKETLRIEVLAGGCNGFQYRFGLDGAPTSEDAVVRHGPAVVVIDPTSLDLLAGAELDYAEALIGSHFAVKNPNAASSCGCGSSFSPA